LNTIVDAETGVRGFVITGNEVFLEPHRSAIQILPEALDSTRRLVKDNVVQQARLDSLKQLTDSSLHFLARCEAARRASDDSARMLVASGKGKKIVDSIRGVISNAEAMEADLLKERENASSESARRFNILFFAMIGLIVLVLTVSYFIITSNIRDLRKAEAEAAEKNKELESFSYSISHDLRAPVRAIEGYSSMLIEDYSGKLDDDGSRLLVNIRRSAQRMFRMIDALLEFARMGTHEIYKGKVDMRALVDRTIAEQLHGKELQPKIIIHDLPVVAADATLIDHVWDNLISNAIKYSSKKENPEIEIGAQSAPGEVTFYVKDNGTGFDMKYSAKLFAVFQRLHRPAEFEGTGIGLAIVQRIIHRHGGRVWAEAKRDEGATFYFTLPA
jgi:signal transduction histidine kinase